MQVFKSEPVIFQLRTITGKNVFLLVKCAPIHLSGRDLLEAYNTHIAFSQKGKMLLDSENRDADQNVIAERLMTVKSMTQIEEEKIDDLLLQVPRELWSSSSSDIGKIKSATPIKVTVDNSKPLPNSRQYPLKPEALNGIRPIIQEFLEKRLIIPCTSPHNTPILPVKKPNGKGWRFVQDLRAINNIVIPRHPVVPNPHTLLSAIPTNSCYFSIIDLCSAFFSIPVEMNSQYLFAFTWEDRQDTWTVLPQG